MKFRVVLISFFVILLLAGALAHADGRKDKVHAQKVQRTVAADSSVTVSLCVMSGTITIRGWNENEVSARSSDVSQIELKRVDATNQSGPARKLTVLMVDKEDDQRETRDCQAFGDVELMVPRGAAVYVQTGDGTIRAVEVASVYARSQTGDIEVEKASRSVEAVSFSGDVSISDSTGRIGLRSVGGCVTATNLRPNDSNDCFEASTVSGDIELNQVAHAQLSAKAVNGNVHLNGPLAHAGQYTFNTTTGDVTLTLPEDASFRLNARLSPEQEITSDFPLTLTIEKASTTPGQPTPEATQLPSKKASQTPSPPTDSSERAVEVSVGPKGNVIKVKPVIVKTLYTSRRIMAVHGTGDALITVASFSGALHLEKN